MISWPKIAPGALVLAALAWAVVEIRQDGAQSFKNTIERQNNEAAGSADAHKLNFDNCPVGMWDFGSGRCRGTAAGSRD